MPGVRIREDGHRPCNSSSAREREGKGQVQYGEPTGGQEVFADRLIFLGRAKKQTRRRHASRGLATLQEGHAQHRLAVARSWKGSVLDTFPPQIRAELFQIERNNGRMPAEELRPAAAPHSGPICLRPPASPAPVICNRLGDRSPSLACLPGSLALCLARSRLWVSANYFGQHLFWSTKDEMQFMGFLFLRNVAYPRLTLARRFLSPSLECRPSFMRPSAVVTWQALAGCLEQVVCFMPGLSR